VKSQVKATEHKRRAAGCDRRGRSAASEPGTRQHRRPRDEKGTRRPSSKENTKKVTECGDARSVGSIGSGAEVSLPSNPPPRHPDEQALVDRWKNQRANRAVQAPHFIEVPGQPGQMRIADSEDLELAVARIITASGVADQELAAHVTDTVARFQGVDRASAAHLAVALLQSIGPRDGIECLIATQAIAVHAVMLAQLQKSNGGGVLSEHAGVLSAKLGNLFLAQIGAIEKRRKGTEQRVIVQHVHVNDQAQAMVAGVQTRSKEGG
jgi:hypothetical protein